MDEEPYDTYVSMLQSGSFDAYYGETQLTPDFDLRPLLSPQGGLNYGSYSSEDMKQCHHGVPQRREYGGSVHDISERNAAHSAGI